MGVSKAGPLFSLIMVGQGAGLLRAIPVGSGPFGIAITPDGTTAYVTSGNVDNVTVIDMATNTVVGSPIPVGRRPRGIAITPDAATAYVVNNGSYDVSVIDLTTNTVTATIAVGDDPQGIAITPGGG